MAPASDAWPLTFPGPRSLTLVWSFASRWWSWRPRYPATTTAADSSLRHGRRPFRHEARYPQVIAHSFIAQPPHLRRFALVTRASWFVAHSPCSAAPSMRFLFIGSQFTLHASFPHSVALMQLRFASLAVTSSREDSHLQDVRPCWADRKKAAYKRRLDAGQGELQRSLGCGTTFSSPGSEARYLDMAFSSAWLNCLTWPAMMALPRPTTVLPSTW